MRQNEIGLWLFLSFRNGDRRRRKGQDKSDQGTEDVQPEIHLSVKHSKKKPLNYFHFCDEYFSIINIIFLTSGFDWKTVNPKSMNV